MKLKIKIKRINKEIALPTIIDKGEWVDLRSSDIVVLKAPQSGTLKKKTINGENRSYRDVSFDECLIPLGIAAKIPKGFEAIILPRSSTFKKFGIIMTNSQGIIDNSYSGNNDEWKFPAAALRSTVIIKGSRVCQFRIQLSQKATIWQKLKWFLSSGIKIVEVDNLNTTDRGGIGSTGVD